MYFNVNNVTFVLEHKKIAPANKIVHIPVWNPVYAYPVKWNTLYKLTGEILKRTQSHTHSMFVFWLNTGLWRTWNLHCLTKTTEQQHVFVVRRHCQNTAFQYNLIYMWLYHDSSSSPDSFRGLRCHLVKTIWIMADLRMRRTVCRVNLYFGLLINNK